MARIRSIKPEFWSSPNLPDDPWARLLYVAMWNWADDNGVGTAIPRELLGFAFPNDEHLTVVDLRRMLVEIRRVFGVKFYEVAGRPYYAIPSWEEHQKFDRRSKGKHPGPEQEESQVRWMKSEDSTESHEPTSSARSDSVAGTGEQGNRGTGISAPTARVDIDSLFDQFWEVWPLKKGKKEARTAFEKAIKSGVTLDRILAGVESYKREIGPSPDWSKVKWPQGWLNGERWEDEPAPKVNASGYHERPPAPEGKRYAVDVASGVPL